MWMFFWARNRLRESSSSPLRSARISLWTRKPKQYWTPYQEGRRTRRRRRPGQGHRRQRWGRRDLFICIAVLVNLAVFSIIILAGFGDFDVLTFDGWVKSGEISTRNDILRDESGHPWSLRSAESCNCCRRDHLVVARGLI